MNHTNENKTADNMQKTENMQKNESNRNEQKIRHNRRAPNNDLWIHVDAQNTDSNKFLVALTGLSTLAAISLVAVSLIQHNQTMMLTKQNELLLEKYGQAMTQLNADNTKALEDLENGLNSVVNSIDRLTIIMAQDSPKSDSSQTEIIVPVEDSAFFGVLVMNDGSAITPLGLRIAGIYDHSPAAKAGIHAGDIIMTIDEIPIDSFEAMSEIIAAKKPGDTISVRFARTQENTVFFNTVSVILDSASNYDTDLSQAESQP